MRKNILLLAAAVISALFASCSDDESFTLSTSARLTFPADTVSLDTLFSRVPSSTYSFWVYNKSGDGLVCSSVRLEGGNQSGYRVNIDGEYLGQAAGYRVSDVEIRKNDSIRVFVELTAPMNGMSQPQKVEDNIVFTLQSGVEQKVNLNAYAWDADFIRNLEVKTDTTIDSPKKPVVVYGGITVDSAATLRVAAGTTLYFHGDAGIDVYGTLITEGTAGSEVVLRGDRTDRMFDYLPYDRVSGQWQGIRLCPSSYGNSISYTDIHSTFDGILCDSADVTREKLLLENSTIHNCQGYGLKATACQTRVLNSQITNTLNDCVCVTGGSIQIINCTLAQFYPFDSNRGAALRYSNYDGETLLPLLKMDFLNSIATGYADDVVMGMRKDDNEETAFSYRFVNSLLRTVKPEDEDENLVNVIFEDTENADSTGEHNFKLVDIDMQAYDFRLDSVSKAIDAAATEYALPTDRNGNSRDGKPDIGCYEYVGQEQSTGY